MDTDRDFLQVRVIPNASREMLAGTVDGVVKVKLQAVPEGGRANRSLCGFLARAAGCSRREVVLIRGEKSRLKTVELPREAAHYLRELAEAD